MKDKFLTPQQVADYLQVDFRTIYSLLRSGKLKGIKVGRVWRISQEVLHEFIKTSSEIEKRRKEK